MTQRGSAGTRHRWLWLVVSLVWLSCVLGLVAGVIDGNPLAMFQLNYSFHTRAARIVEAVRGLESLLTVALGGLLALAWLVRRLAR